MIGGVLNYFFSLIVLVVILLFSKISMGWPLFLFPIILLIMFLFTTSLTFVISALHVYFRDLEHIVGILVMVWFYLTPIVFPESMIPKELEYIFNANPMTIIITSFQDLLYYNQTPPIFELGIGLLVSFIMFFISLMLFQRLSRKFAEVI
ncbi:ABC transporter permease [Cohnella ginsengisoli]|uniref:ABC transporter permease n=1 Tax=Cohnella ginsengisoli TaxID=425004 RepID=UPI003B8A6E7E